MAVVGNFNFFFLRLTWDFLGFESERGGFVCWTNNKIIDFIFRAKVTKTCFINTSNLKVETQGQLIN